MWIRNRADWVERRGKVRPEKWQNGRKVVRKTFNYMTTEKTELFRWLK